MNKKDISIKYEKSIGTFKNNIAKDKNVLAIFIFGSTVNNDSWDKSDIDIAIIFKDGTIKDDYISYSACIDSFDLEVVSYNCSFFMKKINDYDSLSFYLNMINNGKLIYCIDEDIEELFNESLKISRREKEIILLKSGTYAILAKLKAEKHLYYSKDIRLSLDYLNRYIYNLSCIEVTINDEIYGREPEKQAMILNPMVFKKIIDEIYDNKITIEKLATIFEKCNEYLSDFASIIFKPIISWLEEEQREIGISEISDYIIKKYHVNNDIFQITNTCNYLTEKKYFIRSTIKRTISNNSKVLIDEQAYMKN